METRLTPRLYINFKILSRIDRESQTKFSLVKGDNFEVDILDISVGGIGVFSKYFLPRGLRLELQLEGKHFGLGEPIKIKGEVRYCNYAKASGYRCGVKFIDLPTEYKKKIANFIATYDRRAEPRYKLSD